MTDGPMVGFMTIGLALFIAAVFDDQEDASATRKMRLVTSAAVVVAVLPQLILIGREG